MRALRLFCIASVLLAAQAARETRLYDVLGISPDAEEATIKRAYKKQARGLFICRSIVLLRAASAFCYCQQTLKARCMIFGAREFVQRRRQSAAVIRAICLAGERLPSPCFSSLFETPFANTLFVRTIVADHMLYLYPMHRRLAAASLPACFQHAPLPPARPRSVDETPMVS